MRRRDVDRTTAERAIAWAVVAAATLYVIWLGHPDALLNPGAPPRSDLGGHLVALKHLIEVSLPAGRLFDWSHQWFAGYPSFYFYFPLPALAIAGLTLLMPLNAAAKLVALLAPALLPGATFVFVRALGFTRLHAASAVLASVTFLSLTSQYIFGGNVLSSVIGEYSFAIGFALAFFYLSRVALALRGGQHTVALATLLAASALCHVIPTIFAVIASCVALGERAARRQVMTSWVVGFGLAAFWAVPFLVRSPFMGKVLWARFWSAYELFPLDTMMIAPWAIASLFVLRPYLRALRIPIVLGGSAIVLYSLPHGLFAAGRSLPFWHFAFYLWTGLGIAVGLQLAWQRQQRWALAGWVFGIAMLAGVSIIQMELVRERGAGLLATTSSDAPSYQALHTRLGQLPGGRLHWEFRATDPDKELLGARLALARLPAEIAQVRTTQGLLTESALTSSAYSYLLANIARDSMGNRYWRLWTEDDKDPARMRARMRQLGVDYFVSFSDEMTSWAAHSPDTFRELARDSAWTLWRVAGAGLVEPVTAPPRVITKGEWEAEVGQWLLTLTDTTPWPVRASGQEAIAIGRAGVARQAAPVPASLGVRRVSFTTSQVGVPHIVRVSYFPNWRAYGADGPFPAVPGFMMVVPREPNVVLRFEATWVDYAGKIITMLTLVGLMVSAVRRRAVPAERTGRAALA